MRTRLRFAEKVRAAIGAEATMHPVSAVRHALIVAGLSDHRQFRRREANRYGGVADSKILADTAPAKASYDGLRGYLKSDGPAEASSGDHRVLV
jgi:hypothetical protein